MADTNTTKDTVANVVTEDQHFPFLTLPPELRNRIYRHVLVKWCREKNERIEVMTLQQPALCRVNKQTRAEALPIFYGENEFIISLPKTMMAPLRIDTWADFSKMLDVFAQGGCSGVGTSSLQHLTHLIVNYSDQVNENYPAFLLVFSGGYNLTAEECLNVQGRIGDDDLDWEDEAAIEKAFDRTLRANCRKYKELKAQWPTQGVVDAICKVAKECPQATDWVELWLEDA